MVGIILAIGMLLGGIIDVVRNSEDTESGYPSRNVAVTIIRKIGEGKPY